MRKEIFGVAIGCWLAFSLQAQPEIDRNSRNFPIVITLQFHSLSLPFRDIKSNLSNIGFGLGTELGNSSNNWGQQITAVWYHNKSVGNGILFYTQTAWRPTILDDAYTEVKAGAGYLYSFRPTESFKPVNGNWTSVGHKGKGMFTLLAGVSLGSNAYSGDAFFSPFVSYQFLILQGYNKSIPIVPETLLQVGSRIYVE